MLRHIEIDLLVQLFDPFNLSLFSFHFSFFNLVNCIISPQQSVSLVGQERELLEQRHHQVCVRVSLYHVAGEQLDYFRVSHLLIVVRVHL